MKEPGFPAARMQSLRWYEHQKEQCSDSMAFNPRHSFLPFGAATFPLSAWESGRVPTIRADGSPTAYGGKHLPSQPEAGFFVPEHNSQHQRHHLKPFRERFEPLRSHTGRGGGLALSDHRARAAPQLVAWDRPALQRKVLASPLTQHERPAYIR